MSKRKLILIAHNLRSCYNVGSLLRTGDGLGIDELICTGTTPTPKRENDDRLPHVRERAHRQIAKTALGAEDSVPLHYFHKLDEALSYARDHGYVCVALEQTPEATTLHHYETSEQPLALIVGPEVTGLSDEEVGLCDESVEIPMQGTKRSLNVSVAAAIALYALQQ